MSNNYIYLKPVRQSSYSRFKSRLILILAIVIIVGGLGAFIYINLHPKKPAALPAAIAINSTVSDNMQTYTSPFFKFKDNGGKWVLESRSTSDTYIYDKYMGQSLLGEIVFYVNRDIDLRPGTTRVLPVRIVNNSSFEVTGVSDPCVSQYGPNDPHLTQEIEFQGTMMYCNAGDTQYTVVVGAIGGDYHLNLKRPDGSPLSVIITYKFNGLDPSPTSLLNIADSFQTI